MGRNKTVAQSGATSEVAQQPSAKIDSSTQAISRTNRNCLHKQLRKTKFCMFHLQGACQFGKDCAFAHSVTEMSGTPDLRKTQLCKAFSEGKCEDPGCNFAHGEEELRSTDMFFKKSLCIWNEKGKCRNESQCRFAHGLAELHAHQGVQQRKVSDSKEDASKEGQSKTGRRRKGKQNQIQASNSGSGSGSSSDNTRINTESSSNSPRSGSSSDNSSRQSAREPMKVQPRSVTAQEPSPVVSEQQVLQQQFQQLRGQYQETLMQCLGALEGDYLTMEAARWQRHLNPIAPDGYNPEIQADLENLRQGIGMLAAQCNQIQQRMQSAVPKVPPPYMASMLQNRSMGKPYPKSSSVSLLPM